MVQKQPKNTITKKHKIMETKKITLSTLKSFLRKNEGSLFLNVKSDFDGMIDGMRYLNGGFRPAKKIDGPIDNNNLGIRGLWVVGGSRNLFTSYEDENFTGIKIWNCCQSSIIAVKK